MDKITLNNIYDDILTIKQQLIYIRENMSSESQNVDFNIKVLEGLIEQLITTNRDIRQIQTDLLSIHGSLLHESKGKGC